MSYKQLLRQTLILFVLFVIIHFAVITFMFYLINIRQMPPLLKELVYAVIFIAVAIAGIGLLMGQVLYNQRIQVLGAIESVDQKVIVYRKALFYRLAFWGTAAVWCAVLYYLTGLLTILFLSIAFIPLTVSSISALLLMKNRLNLSDEDVENMFFIKESSKRTTPETHGMLSTENTISIHDHSGQDKK